MPLFDRKTWHNRPDTTTPLGATGLNDLEGRIAAATAPPAMEVWRNTNQSIPDSTITEIVWEAGAANSDYAATFWTPSAPELITFPDTGTYSVILHIAFDDASRTGHRFASIRKVGEDGDSSGGVTQVDAVEEVGGWTQFQVVTHLKIASPGIQIKAEVFHDGGVPVNLASSFDQFSFAPTMMIARIADPYDREIS